MVLRAADIERLVAAEGFDLCGITRAEPLEESEERFRRWIDSGYGAPLSYLYNHQELRFDVSKLVEGGRSVIVCGVNYKSDHSMSNPAQSGVGISSYALMRDYHKTIKKAMKRVLMGLTQLSPNLSGRVFTDSAPLMEKSLAVRAGLGWIGRQSLLVTPEYGTFVLLGEIVIDQEVDLYNESVVQGRCGECRACIDSCPVGAINGDRTIDTRLCIACRTIECDDAGDLPLAGWVFGCDECQSCCPHNRRSPNFTNHDMRPIITPPTADEWREMSEEQFEELTRGTPLRRSSLERIKRCVDKNLSR